jgi:hypothetical protein
MGGLTRVFVAITLLACPYVCGAGELDRCAHDSCSTCCPDESRHAPLHCSDEAGSCVCQGALRGQVGANEGPAHDSHADLFSIPCSPPLTKTVGTLSAALCRAMRPTATASAERALLQIFRC